MDHPKFSSTPTVIIVDDDSEDVALLRRAFRKSELNYTIVHHCNGEELIDALENKDRDQSLWPNLILLDLNMPVLDGRQTLAQLKADPRFCKIPVLVLSSTSDNREVDSTYALGANSFISKSSSLLSIERTVNAIESYWFKLVQLPQPI